MKLKATREELMSRMKGHVAYHEGDATCKLLWKGYFAGLMEWGVLDADDYHALNDAVGELGQPEVIEIFLGYPGQYE